MVRGNRFARAAPPSFAGKGSWSTGKFEGKGYQNQDGDSSSTDDFTKIVRFDGFPYIVTKIVGALCHIILLPKDTIFELTVLARTQVLANRLPTCLVLSEASSLYFSPESGEESEDVSPFWGILVDGKLRLSRKVDDSEELRRRSQQLAAFIRAKNYSGFLLGNLTKGGKDATVEEQTALNGVTENGIPKGLEICPACSCFRGMCVDPSEEFQKKITQIHCYCDNWNRCACCGETLAVWRLNANYYNPKDNAIWHVPGFCGLSHQCKDETTNKP